MNAEMEARRNETVRSYGLLDAPLEPAYDDISRLAAQVCGMPIAAVSVLYGERMWIQAGLGVRSGPVSRDVSLCAKVVEAGRPIVVGDASRDDRFLGSPYVTGETGIRFYAGVPLLLPPGIAVGALCVADRVPGELSPARRDALEILARQVAARMELRRGMTEAELAARRWAEQEEMLRAIFDLEPECVSVLDPDGTIRRMNRAGLSFLEADSLERLAGRNWLEFVVPADRERVQSVLDRIRSGGTAVVEFDAEGIRGGRRTLESHAVPMRGHGILSITRDVTARRQAETALLRKGQELCQAQKMEAVGRMAGGMAHDFNNILTALLGYGRLLLGELPGESAAHGHALEIMRAAERATRLCRRLLAFSRKQPFHPEVLDLRQLISGIVVMLGPLLGDRIEARLEIPEGLWSVRADQSQLEQVLVNLAVNARDAMPGGGYLGIEARNEVVEERPGPSPKGPAPGRYAVLTVRDTGVGMAPEVLAHLFEPFFTTKDQGKGTGLGLSTVYGIVRQSGGHVEVSSRPGSGTAFTVYLPAADADPAPPALPSRVAGNGVLVVEDAVDVRFLARNILEARGYRVFEATTGLDALLELSSRSGAIQMLLTDISLPGLSGLELATRARIVKPDVRILFMSGRPEDPRDADGFLAKPFTPDELVRAVERAFGR